VDFLTKKKVHPIFRMANALVLTCIDPRFISKTTKFLNNYKELHKDFDLFVLAGSELGYLTKENWRNTATEHIDLAIKLHKIKKIICISHMDCGMYKQYYNKIHDTNLGLHEENQIKLQEHLKRKYPDLEFSSWILDKKFIRTI